MTENQKKSGNSKKTEKHCSHFSRFMIKTKMDFYSDNSSSNKSNIFPVHIILNKYFRSLMDTLGNNFTEKEFSELEEKAAENGKFYFDKLYKFILG